MLQNPDRLSIHEGQIPQVQNHLAILAFQFEQRLQFGHVFYIQATYQSKDGHPIRKSPIRSIRSHLERSCIHKLHLVCQSYLTDKSVVGKLSKWRKFANWRKPVQKVRAELSQKMFVGKCLGDTEAFELHLALKWFLSISNDLIFDSSVDRGMLSLAAAPDGPDTRPPHSLNADSIVSFSCMASN
jgi:hypothetical protein